MSADVAVQQLIYVQDLCTSPQSPDDKTNWNPQQDIRVTKEYKACKDNLQMHMNNFFPSAEHSRKHEDSA